MLYLEDYTAGASQCSFYRIPKALFCDKRYEDVALEAKVLYSLLLDRMSLSAKNGWLDSARRIFIYFTLEDVQTQLNCGHTKAIALMGELETLGLIERKKQGQGRPAKIYVKVFADENMQVSKEEPKEIQETSQAEPSTLPQIPAPSKTPQTSENETPRLPENGSLDFSKTDANETERKEIKRSYTEPSILPYTPSKHAFRKMLGIDQMDSFRKEIQANIDYDWMILDKPEDQDLIDGYVELMAEACSQRGSVRISGSEIPVEQARSRFLRLDCRHIDYVIDCMRRTTGRIGNIKGYLLAALYNAPVTMEQYYISLVGHDMAQAGA